MRLNFNPATRARLLADLTLGFDPIEGEAEVKVDDTWHPAVWLSSEPAGDRWIAVARTTDYFCGPDATPLGATVLDLGRHATKTRVTLDGDQLVAESDPIDVR